MTDLVTGNPLMELVSTQPEPVRKAARILVGGRVQIWPNEHPLMAKFRERDIENLEANVRAAKR